MAKYTFSGDFTVTLDAKNRINVPAAIRKILTPESNGTLVFTQGFEGCVFVYPDDVWQSLTHQLLQLDQFDLKVRNFTRIFVGRAHPVSMDSQGRVILSEKILKMAGIDKDILFLGSINKLEMWNPAVYDKFIESNALTLEGLSEQINFGAILKNDQ